MLLPIYRGVGWAMGVQVENAEPEDILVITARSAEGNRGPVELHRRKLSLLGRARVEVPGSLTAQLGEGRHNLQFALIRGEQAGIFESRMSVPVFASFAGPLGVERPLFGPAGETLVFRAETVSPTEIKLVAWTFSEGPTEPRPPGGSSEGYVHIQSEASAEWIINHGLGLRPHATVTDTSGREVHGDFQHVSITRSILRFSSAFAGEAYLS